MGSERREYTHMSPIRELYIYEYTYCLNPDIRTRHNDNDDAPFFFFIIISVYDELPLWGVLMQGEVYRVSMQSMWPVVVHLMGIGRLNSKPPET